MQLVFMTIGLLPRYEGSLRSLQTILPVSSELPSLPELTAHVENRADWVMPAILNNGQLAGLSLASEEQGVFQVRLIALHPEYKERSVVVRLLQAMMMWAARNKYPALFLYPGAGDALVIAEALSQLNFQLTGYLPASGSKPARVRLEHKLNLYDLSVRTRFNHQEEPHPDFQLLPVLARYERLTDFLRQEHPTLFAFEGNKQNQARTVGRILSRAPDASCLFYRNDEPIGFVAGYNHDYAGKGTLLSLKFGGRRRTVPPPWQESGTLEKVSELAKMVGYRGLEFVTGCSERTLICAALRDGFSVAGYRPALLDSSPEVILEKLFN